jgi:hypothetical protein|tara:strand:+ start:136 stop:594 length:459 start_codon:yes stop_codon:yes gene_type:complete
MRKIEAQTIQAIRALFWEPEHSGTYWRSGNMEVLQAHDGIRGTYGYERVIKVELHGNVIAKIWPADEILEVSDCGWRTSTTKSRINTILSCLCGDGTRFPGVYQKAGDWFFSWNTWTDGIPWSGKKRMSYALNADNWTLKLAEKKAAAREVR